MSGKRYYWLKLKEDFFTSKRIKKLRKLAGGDTYTIIYLKMQLLSLKTDGILRWSGLEDNFADELALDIDENPENVRVVLQYLLSCGLAETDDNTTFFLPWVAENTGSENAGTQRVRDFRSRQKALQCNADVTEVKRIGNAEKEIEIEKEKELEKEKRERTTPFAAVVEAWNALNLSPIRKITGERERLLKARIKEYGEAGVLEAIQKVHDSDFLQGHGDRGWVITFDWFLGPRNFAKVLEGNYSNKTEKKNTAPTMEELRYIEQNIVKKPPKMACAPQSPYSEDEWDKVMDRI